MKYKHLKVKSKKLFLSHTYRVNIISEQFTVWWSLRLQKVKSAPQNSWCFSSTVRNFTLGLRQTVLYLLLKLFTLTDNASLYFTLNKYSKKQHIFSWEVLGCWEDSIMGKWMNKIGRKNFLHNFHVLMRMPLCAYFIPNSERTQHFQSIGH